MLFKVLLNKSLFLWGILLLFLMFILRESEPVPTGEGQKEGERESQAGSMPSTEPDMGLHPTNHEIMT